MRDNLHKTASVAHQKARGDLTNGSTCYTLMLPENIKANRAEWWNTPHGSHPTLTRPVNGLLRIIQNRETLVLRGFGGPTDFPVGLGRFAVPVGRRG